MWRLYSRLVGANEEGTLARLKAPRHWLLDPKIADHHRPMVGIAELGKS